jgi:hypothetical protein
MYNNRNYNEYGRHIQDEQMYRDAVRNLRWNNGRGQGERWKKEDLIDRSGINFNEEYFTPYDYAYSVNMMYADYGKMSEKPEPYEQMGKDYLHNDSFPERGDERAYYDAEMRSRRYNNRYDDGMRYEYTNRYQNRRGYNERGSYGDRDNDGRYNEGR